MKKAWILAALAATTLTFADETPANKTGVVNFADCVTNSKYGKQEQENFENLRNQMQQLAQDTEKQLKEVVEQMNDADHLDGLSPDGVKELEAKYKTLSEEMGKYQNQYYQVLQQANQKMVFTMQTRIAAAAESVRKTHGYTNILNKDACFAFSDDITNLILEQLDAKFDIENAQQVETKE